MKKIGIVFCGSFCTLKESLLQIEKLAETGYDLYPIFSYNVKNLDTRFFAAEDFRKEVVRITGKEPVTTIPEAETFGTKNKMDLMLVAPCTGNTLSKLALGITDTPATLAVKAHLRNKRPVVLSIATNDALGASAKNIGLLLNTRNYYFVPLWEDAPTVKENSLVADTSLIPRAVEAAFEGKQLQPVLKTVEKNRE